MGTRGDEYFLLLRVCHQCTHVMKGTKQPKRGRIRPLFCRFVPFFRPSPFVSGRSVYTVFFNVCVLCKK